MRLFSLFTLLVFVSLSLFAQEDLLYQKPSASILALADYERAPSISMDSKMQYMLLSYRNTYKTLDDLNQDELRLGGLRINPKTNISSTTNFIHKLAIKKVQDIGANPQIVNGLPNNPKISFLNWSPDESKIAFVNVIQTGAELWVIDVKTASAKRLTDASLSANINSPFTWHPNSKQLLVKMIPNNRKALLDVKKDLPKGPIVSNAEGKVSQNRTYTDLLKNKSDEENFEIIVASELVIIDLDGNKSKFKSSNLFTAQSFSPDGNFVMLTYLQKPFSYLVPYSRFPMTTFVYDMQGNEIKKVNDVPLTEIMPKGFAAVRKGKRYMDWRNDKSASLYYVEALDGGDPANLVTERDELFSWDAPFNQAPTSIMKTKQRFSDVIWGNDNVAIVSDSWYDTRNTKTYLINPTQKNQVPKVVFDRNYQDVYSDPGNFEITKNALHQNVLLVNRNELFLIGDGFTKAGQFPFVDALNLSSLKTKRIYQSLYKDKKESILSFEYKGKDQICLVQIQSKNEYPNYFIRNLANKKDLKQVTFMKNPFESIASAYKEVVKYKRADGVDLSGTLYLPVGYDKVKKEKLPLLIWAYPEEFKDKASAGQSKQNPNEFTFPNYGSFIYWITKGYAVLDDASFPIIGEEKKEPNDSFLEQLVANGKAAIDAIDALGFIDRTKVAVGGHSYGAFMTANLLTHSNLFACGIARSGAYNRTLTPFGFQSEQRNFWDIPTIYNEMSPFYSANKLKNPILLIHGEADNNPGTFTLQSERYFQALKGLGAKARMVILPKESHGYAAKENIFHLLWEQEQFLDKYLKH
jgi:dipeptidyl aminopeptidase/acylaminoacyl peptidase